jgi:hypothetical protein
MPCTFEYLHDTDWISRILAGKPAPPESHVDPEYMLTPLLQESIKKMLGEKLRPRSYSFTDWE